MFDFYLLGTFVIVVLGLFVIPGPAVLLTLARSISGGRRVGVATGLGIAAGDMVHTAMAAVGLSALLMTSALAFEIVKSGVGLPCLARTARADRKDRGADHGIGAPDRSFGRLSAGGVDRGAEPEDRTVLPGVPAAVRTSGDTPPVVQFAVLGLIFVLMSAAYTSLIAFGAGGFGRFLARHRGIGRWQRRLVGGIYLGLGVKLALQQR